MSDANDIDNLEQAPPSADGDEFAGLAPAPARKSPIMAVCIIALSAFTIFHLRHDLRYALSPRQVVPVVELSGAGASAVGRYVSVSGIPDRHDSLYIEPRGDKARESLFLLLDSDPPVFVRARDTADRADLESTWKGRLQRFSDVGWASSLRDYFGKAPQKTTRALDLVSLRGHLADASVALHDRRGRVLPLDGTTEVEVVEKPSEYALYLGREKFPKKEDAQRELTRVFASRPSTPRPEMGEDTTESFVFLLPFEKDSAKQNELMGLLQRENIDVEAYAKSRRSPLSSLTVADWDMVSEVDVAETLSIGEDALVLTEGEAPASYTWTLFVVGLMLVLCGFNLWYLFRPRRS